MKYRPWAGVPFGVELEFSKERRGSERHPILISAQQIARSIATVVGSQNIDHRVGDWHHTVGTSLWDVKSDSTSGWEVASPVLTLSDDGHNEALRNVCAAIRNDLDPRVTKKCGFHVHIDLEDYTWKDMQNLLRLWTRYEPFWFAMQPPSRRDNVYCRPIKQSTWKGGGVRIRMKWPAFKEAMKAETSYQFESLLRDVTHRPALNMNHWWRNRRVEFRIGGGTLDYDKIRHWVMLLSAIIKRVKMENMPDLVNVHKWTGGPGVSTDYVAGVLGLAKSRYFKKVAPESAELIEWMKARRAAFKDPGDVRPATVRTGRPEGTGRGRVSPALQRWYDRARTEEASNEPGDTEPEADIARPVRYHITYNDHIDMAASS